MTTHQQQLETLRQADHPMYPTNQGYPNSNNSNNSNGYGNGYGNNAPQKKSTPPPVAPRPQLSAQQQVMLDSSGT